MKNKSNFVYTDTLSKINYFLQHMKNPTIKSHGSISRPLKMVEKILSHSLIKEINKKIKINKEVSILDLGSGVGRSLWELSSFFSTQEKILLL